MNRFARALANVFRGTADAESDDSALEMVERRIGDEDLKRWRESRAVSARELADRLLEELRFPIRQYAHVHQESKDPATRIDFTETLFWNPIMVTDSTGTAIVEFELSDSQTSFRVLVDGHSDDGRLGQATAMLSTSLPMQIDAKLPLEVSAGDRIDVAVGVVNSTEETKAFEIALASTMQRENPERELSVELSGGERSTLVVPMIAGPTSTPRDVPVGVSAQLKNEPPIADAVRRSVRVVPVGYPFRAAHSGQITDSTSVAIDLPPSIVEESVTGKIKFFPSLETELMSGVESMLREPHGCFEQTSASNYPNVMIYQLLSAQGQLNDPLRRRIESLVRRGYRKLAQYECSTLGFEWFGNDPGHEALSAFGLMQFSEMADIVTVDREMVNRTRRWLLSRRDGEGSFRRNSRHLHQWSIDQDYVNAYVLWAISEADQALDQSIRTAQDFSTEFDRLEKVALSESDPYLIAVSTLALDRAGRTAMTQQLRSKLAQAQSPDGSVEGMTTITQSGGLSRLVETTSLAILAWADDAEHKTSLASALEWLRSHRSDGGFGSTQATVLALKALVSASSRPIQQSWKVDFLVSGTRVHQMAVERDDRSKSRSVSLPPAVIEAIMSGRSVEIVTGGGEPLVFSVSLEGRTLQPESSRDCAVGLTVRLPDHANQSGLPIGDTVGVQVNLSNRTDEGLPMTMAIIGIPGGLEPVIESLEKLRDSGQIDFYELRGREVALYWRTLDPKQTKLLSIRCVGQYGGSFRGPASRAYLYYTAESKHWCAPISIEIGDR